jgi:hypothetical protein
LSQEEHKQQVLEIANQIKNNYKKLHEYQKSAKLAEELLSIAATQGQFDDEILLQMREQL